MIDVLAEVYTKTHEPARRGVTAWNSVILQGLLLGLRNLSAVLRYTEPQEIQRNHPPVRFRPGQINFVPAATLQERHHQIDVSGHNPGAQKTVIYT